MLISDNNPKQHCRWHVYRTTPELEQAALQVVMESARQAIAQRGAFHVVLAGGTTPRRLYEQLHNTSTDWSAWYVYFGDERCLPPDHSERNSRMAAQAWLDHVAIPPAQIHPIPAEKGPEAAAQAYSQKLAGVELFDLVLLGLGEDGHTASLFPGHDPGKSSDAPDAIFVTDAPKPPPQRVSLSARRLSAARQVMFLVTGAAKKQAVHDWRSGVGIPAAAIAPSCGVDVYLEESLLSRA